MNTSFSKLNTFKTCPLKYKFQEIDKLKAPKSAVQVFGTLMHSTMQFIHTSGFTTPSQKEALNYFSTNWNSEIFESEVEERSAFAQGIRIVQNYYKKNHPADANIVDLESRFTIELQDKQEKHLISGIIDRIDKTEQGFEIIDYKTSKKMPPQKTIDENMQLLIYLLAFLQRYPKENASLDKIDLSLFFLHHNSKLTTNKTSQQLHEGRQSILEIIHEIEKSDFPAIANPLCSWCEFQDRCPMWKHKYKKQPASDKEKGKLIEEYIEAQENAKVQRAKATSLNKKILQIMEEEGVERLFGKDRIIGKTHRQTFDFDEEKLKEILQEKGMWENVLKLNQVQLKKVLETLPSSTKREIERLGKLKSESWGLSIKKQ